ncbi:flagellar biosynthesis protein FlhA [Ketogulonicigenium vulgare]|uniref:Flagellar biosynthesis protein FlhA n=1 Tax=Ketogulonicigenium vulgare (strain WSH-001) TaxID=759362 RepID=F9Y4G8_KETVW|nr:flagellar biosynthesis protein FlhA [Ketogulonicigenium vulgare]ADO43502.1 flagellar biosynthesis protein FlhA [Ketogulonicigenium vulgare Y25]AEM41781.1 Flagellar biosynthesis protein FlhA [Ketogulonicigenium vulgare WSH-001]ALJ81887.1 flagellar biosynthesis protein FlhA [Ketogulonicigenium vulgare]ANW34536.1 flagellar biosynthesis protein FlhA [Ketogulonicigenium vulgare]AOZ55537.1 flagellar biosynthetic protein FlbF [Ketogulonicigenium vulgare]
MIMDMRNLFSPTVALALALLTVIIMMVLPMPSWVLDIGLAVSFSLAILIFTVTLFVERPLDFSSFPTVLLASLLLRLSLSVSSTKLIIGQGHTGTDAAGHVIEGFANFVMGGSIMLGLVIFCVLLIVNFMVINKGAARMAEVGARFALDAMPGKQLAIDADMASGAIDHAEARARREREQAETTFFGSLDGASKFVKGDAVAGLLITALTLVAGLASGVFVQGMAIGQAFETYAILTVGDGLVSQIPAVIISVASALLLARGGANGAVDLALIGQLGRQPAPLFTVAALMLVLALVPGLPTLPFLGAALALGYGGYLSSRALKSRQKAKSQPQIQPAAPPRTMGDVMDIDDIHVEFAPDLVEMVLDPATGLDARIATMRNHVATAFGLLLPEIRLTDNPALPVGSYVVLVQGVEQARAVLRPGRMLALLPSPEAAAPSGEDVREPVYGAPARWIAPDVQADAALLGMTTVQPAEVLATHLLEVIKRNFARLMTHKALRKRLDEMVNLSDTPRADANRKFIDEMVPDRVPVDLLLAVLRLLLDERVSIRNLPLIIESVAEARALAANPEAVAEHVRQRLGFQLVAELRRADGTIPLVQLAPEWEEIFTTYQIGADRSVQDVALPPEEFNRLATAIADRIGAASDQNSYPALVTSGRRRRFLRTVLQAKGIPNPVLSFEEIGVDARPALVGVVAA